MNVNEAPYPHELQDLVEALHYKDRWVVTLNAVDRGQGSVGLTLCILITTPDSYDPERLRSVMHYMPVPPAAYDRRSWCRWLLDQIIAVETHEACEFFRVGESRPFAPNHGPGRNPYSILELSTPEDVATSYRGERKP